MHLANYYINLTPRGGRYRIRIYLPEEKRDAPVVICSELPSNEGSSVTYSAHQIAAEVIRYHKLALPLVWVEHYPKAATDGASGCDDLGRRLAEKRSEKDRYVKLYVRGLLFEEGLDLYLTDLKNATDNLKLLLEAADAEVAQRRERIESAEGVEAWLLALRERVAEVEEDSEETYR